MVGNQIGLQKQRFTTLEKWSVFTHIAQVTCASVKAPWVLLNFFTTDDVEFTKIHYGSVFHVSIF